MNQLIALASILGVLSPLVISLINQAHWAARTKAAVAAGFSLALGVLAAWTTGQLDGADWHTLRGIITALAIVWAASQSSYRGLRATGLTDWIEQATTRPLVATGTGTASDPAVITSVPPDQAATATLTAPTSATGAASDPTSEAR